MTIPYKIITYSHPEGYFITANNLLFTPTFDRTHSINFLLSERKKNHNIIKMQKSQKAKKTATALCKAPHYWQKIKEGSDIDERVQS